MKQLKHFSETVTLMTFNEFYTKACPLREVESEHVEFNQSVQRVNGAFFHEEPGPGDAVMFDYVRRIVELRPPSKNHLQRCVINSVHKGMRYPNKPLKEFIEDVITNCAYDFVNITHLVKISNRKWAAVNIDEVRLFKNPNGDEALVFQSPITIYHMDITREMFLKRWPEHDLDQAQLDNLKKVLE